MPLQPAPLTFSADGTPYSETYGEAYHTRTGGLGQAQHVFLGGNGLPGRWQGRERFVVVETGFGLGLNFLATWAAWKNDPLRCAQLHFVSVEKHPFTAKDLAKVYQDRALAALAPFAAQLQARWPALVPGFHRLHFDGGRVALTLVLGDATTRLSQLEARGDAFYLDGFSPAKNPDLWAPELCATLSRIAAPGATLATWSVASGMRESLAACGWSLDKVRGYAGKRDMLRGRWPGAARAEPGRREREKRAIVIGAGIAGTSAAERLAARGWSICLIDRAPSAGRGASGNLAGVFRPLPSLDDNRLARLTRACFLYARRHFAQLVDEGLPLRWETTGVLHLARDDAHGSTQKRVVETWQPPGDYLRYVGRETAQQLAGWPVAAGGWWFPGGAWVEPPSLCHANLARHGARIRPHFAREVESIERRDGRWHACDAAGDTIATAPVLILANAADAKRFAPAAYLPLRAARGQVSHLPSAAGQAPQVVVCRLGYVTPAIDGVRCAGATFSVGDAETAPRPAEHAENLAKLEFMLPGYGAKSPVPLDPQTLDGRVGFRPASPDRLPMIGAVADASAVDPALPSRPLKDIPRIPGLYLIDGFGARGIVWSALAGELLAGLIEGEPLPLEAELAAAVDPARFLLRGKNRRIA
ncbi:MAG: bifunctional tRNA (5-methylaminomethyl-2-thiouridine)(34)-methyltransferase MnmD/FAD-dependent 5-carboxymethylaminomethyl-2-thiouridine(34) oxidoreductase MnmC [Betaproteobacteria bacterium]|nr:bifunctional tRNA (5-methylaminomethyl-2-thiouridine)(34)-methyltransferase MnmD/FAD-dependent 5-carboxymethylaminomethyl-2-thiouridine(34) oxidoreductase MnmC [Betaproteobacteria bacterium]